MNNNDKISKWMGKPCTCVTELDSENIVQGIPQKTRYWGNCAIHGNGGVSIPWETSDRRAVELLPVLADRGYKITLESDITGGNVGYLFEINGNSFRYCALQPTISEAIIAAVLQLIERVK